MMYWLLLIGTLAVHQAAPQTFAEFKTSMEMKVVGLANQMSTLYDQRCNVDMRSCTDRSYYEC